MGKKALFEDVSIKFVEGECYGLIGANGAGKLIDKITTYDEYLESDEMARKRFTFTVVEDED